VEEHDVRNQAAVSNPVPRRSRSARKTICGGKHVATGDTIFVFASENEGEPGLVAKASCRGRSGSRNAGSPAKHHV
jgi:hypothetical protein